MGGIPTRVIRECGMTRAHNTKRHVYLHMLIHYKFQSSHENSSSRRVIYEWEMERTGAKGGKFYAEERRKHSPRKSLCHMRRVIREHGIVTQRDMCCKKKR